MQASLVEIENIFQLVSKGNTDSLETLLESGVKSEDDKLTPACVAMMQSIRNLIEESHMLAQAAESGNLSVRGDSDRFEGGYRTVIQGMNTTLDVISEPMAEISSALSRIAEKDLNVTVTENYRGDYAKIMAAMNTTIKNLNEIMARIDMAARDVEAAADQVSSTGEILAQGASEQASSLQQISATVSEVSEHAKRNVEGARNASELALKAKQDAENGSGQMDRMLESMEGIRESSSYIENVIKVIDDIAFQTNLLALNAAVEAARAGEHGKGFAVVADEVKNLAARSANAVKETADMIGTSISRVKEGAKIANETAAALDMIIRGVENAAEIIGTIAELSVQQATAISEIKTGVNMVADVTQSTTATSEESASHSQQLAAQAQSLKAMIEEFQLKHEQVLLMGSSDSKRLPRY